MRKSELLALIHSLEQEVAALQKRVLDAEQRLERIQQTGRIHRPVTSPPTPGWVCPVTPNGA
jgi:Ni,Fe-hydrogenase III large subunit